MVEVPRQRQDWEAARTALTQAVSLLETLPGGKLASIEENDLKTARELLAEADKHLPVAKAGSLGLPSGVTGP